MTIQIADLHAALDAAEASGGDGGGAAEATYDAPAMTAKPVDAKAPIKLGAAPAEETEAEETAETEAQTEAPATEETTETPAAPVLAPEEAIFTPEALATPEGLETARKWLTDSKTELKEKFREHSRQMVKFNKRVVKQKARALEQQQKETLLVQIGTEQRVAAQSLLTGGAKDIAAALGRITGRDPIPLIRELSMLIATDGKNNGRGDPKIEELRGELEAIKKRDEDRAQQMAQAQEQAQFEAAQNELLTLAQDATQWPRLAAYANASKSQAAEVRQRMTELMLEAHDAGNPISRAQAAKYFEDFLEAEQKASPAASVSGAAPSQGQAKPAPAPVAKQGLNSKDTSTAPRRRPRGEPESVEELAADPRFLQQLGFG
jgi:hypothetical protein